MSTSPDWFELKAGRMVIATCCIVKLSNCRLIDDIQSWGEYPGQQVKLPGMSLGTAKTRWKGLPHGRKKLI